MRHGYQHMKQVHNVLTNLAVNECV